MFCLEAIGGWLEPMKVQNLLYEDNNKERERERDGEDMRDFGMINMEWARSEERIRIEWELF